MIGSEFPPGLGKFTFLLILDLFTDRILVLGMPIRLISASSIVEVVR
jgi:hypothetical protein